MKRIAAAVALIVALLGQAANAAGTIPIVLQQQLSFTGCATTAAVCGTPLAGGLVFFYQAGTVATRQDSFADTALTIPNQWPLTLDANGRVPLAYLADGSIHVRLTDASGVVQFDTTMLVIGPSSGGGGGGGTVDPTTVFSTGDVKFRPTSESLNGWVKLNALTIGSSISGATGRANSDTQSLFVYLWTQCPDRHCPVLGGRGSNALADFNANKQLTVPDWRASTPVGLDDMGASAAGILLQGNISSAGDTPTTPGASGGTPNPTLTVNQIPVITPSGTVSAPAINVHTRTFLNSAGVIVVAVDATNDTNGLITNSAALASAPAFTGSPFNPSGGQSFPSMPPFRLGTWYVKL